MKPEQGDAPFPASAPETGPGAAPAAGDVIKVGDIQGSIAAIGAGAQVVYQNIERALTEVEVIEKALTFEHEQIGKAVSAYVQRLHRQAELAQVQTGRNNPYKALAEYDIEDAALFYGRQQAIQKVSALLKRPFTVLHAESGAGKTSLLKAGLTPRLLAEGHVPVYIRAYRTPVHHAIKHRLLPEVAQIPSLANDSLERLLVHATDLLGGKHLVIMLDQFEEVFREQRPEERSAFVEQLTACLANNVLPVRWLVSLRGEWLSQLSAFEPAVQNPFANQYPLLAFRCDEAKEVIEEPSRQYGIAYERKLVNELLDKLDTDGIAPPQLQLVCSRLFEELAPDQRRITLAMYDAAGCVEGILNEHLRRVLDQNLRPQLRTPARRLLEALITSDGRRQRCTRSQLAQELTRLTVSLEMVDEILSQLVNSRLLRTIEGEAGAADLSYELVHDYLLQEIHLDPQMQAQKAAREMLAREVRDFERSNGKFLLSWDKYTFITSQEAHLILDEPASQLLALSRSYHQSEQEKKLRQEQDLRRAEEQARHEAEERAAASEARLLAEKQARRRAYYLGGAGLLAVVLATIAIVLLQGLNNAVQERLKNEIRLLAAHARQQLHTDPIASLQLSLRGLLTSTEQLSDVPVYQRWLIYGSIAHARPLAYVPEAEFTLAAGVRAALERRYRDLRQAPESLTASQIAIGASQLAVGGDGLYLVDQQVSEVITLAGHTGEVLGVQWSQDAGLLSYDQHHLRVWRNAQLVTEHPFEAGIHCAAWAPDNKQIAVCSGATLWLWSTNQREPQVLHQFATRLLGVRWAPEHPWLVAWDERSTMLFWDGDGSRIEEAAHQARIWDAAWSPDSEYLVSVDGDGVAHIWPTRSLEPPQRLDINPGRTFARFVAPDRFVTWSIDSFDNAAQLWTVAGEALRPLSTAAGRVNNVALLSSGDLILILAHSGSARLWDLNDAQARPVDLLGHSAPVHAVAESEDGRYLATAGEDGEVRVWRIADGEPVTTLYGHGSSSQTMKEIFAVRWSDPQHLLTAGEDGSVRLWQVFDDQGFALCASDGDDGLPRCIDPNSVVGDHRGRTTFARWRDNGTIISVGLDGVAAAWSWPPGSTRLLTSTTDVWTEVVWDPAGERVLTYVAADNLGALEQPDPHGLIRTFATGAVLAKVAGPIGWATWLEAGLLISRTGELVWVDPATGQTDYALAGYPARITAAQQAASGRLAVAYETGAILVWEPGRPEPSFRLDTDLPFDRQHPVESLQWRSDGQQLLAVGRKIVLWNLQEQTPVWSVGIAPDNAGEIVHGLDVAYAPASTQATLSPNGEYVAIALDNLLYVLDAATGEVRWFNGDHRRLTKIRGIDWVSGRAWQIQPPWWKQLLPWVGDDPRLLLLTWSDDRTARLWDWTHRRVIMRVVAAGPIDQAAFSEDGAHLFTAAVDETGATGMIRVWRSWHGAPEGLIATAQSLLTRDLSNEQRVTFSLQPVAPQ